VWKEISALTERLMKAALVVEGEVRADAGFCLATIGRSL
jgi:hypothetical protein